MKQAPPSAKQENEKAKGTDLVSPPMFSKPSTRAAVAPPVSEPLFSRSSSLSPQEVEKEKEAAALAWAAAEEQPSHPETESIGKGLSSPSLNPNMRAIFSLKHEAYVPCLIKASNLKVSCLRSLKCKTILWYFYSSFQGMSGFPAWMLWSQAPHMLLQLNSQALMWTASVVRSPLTGKALLHLYPLQRTTFHKIFNDLEQTSC